MSRDQQRQLGLQVAAQVYQQMPVLPDSSEETKYIRQLGEKLVATIPPEYSWPFEFHVVAQKDINAFALPGGPMFVNIGTITAAANEAQLAGVMAHEMSHVIMQHSAKQAGKAQTTGLIAGIAGAVLGGVAGGAVGQLGQMGIQMGAQGLMMKYSRGDETQADEVGAIILYKAGYNPQAMADFFRTLESEGGPSSPQWLSDHPNPGNREKNIEQEIRNWPPKKYASDSPAFESSPQARHDREGIHRPGDCGRCQIRAMGCGEQTEWRGHQRCWRIRLNRPRLPGASAAGESNDDGKTRSHNNAASGELAGSHAAEAR